MHGDHWSHCHLALMHRAGHKVAVELILILDMWTLR